MTLPADVVDLRGAAAQLGVGYHFLQSNWRTLEGFPPPFIGGGKRERPRWAKSCIDEYKRGRRWVAGAVATVAASALHAPANDPSAFTPPSDPVALLLAAAG